MTPILWAGHNNWVDLGDDPEHVTLLLELQRFWSAIPGIRVRVNRNPNPSPNPNPNPNPDPRNGGPRNGGPVPLQLPWRRFALWVWMFLVLIFRPKQCHDRGWLTITVTPVCGALGRLTQFLVAALSHLTYLSRLSVKRIKKLLTNSTNACFVRKAGVISSAKRSCFTVECRTYNTQFRRLLWHRFKSSSPTLQCKCSDRNGNRQRLSSFRGPGLNSSQSR